MSVALDVCSSVTNECSSHILLSIKELSDEIEMFGLQCLPKYTVIERDAELSQNVMKHVLKSVIEAAFNVIQYHRRTVQQYEDAEEKKQRLIDDGYSFKATTQRLRTDLVEKEKLLNLAAEQERKLKTKMELMQREMEVQKQEITRLKSQMKNKENQAAHTIRRKEQELIRLQNEVHQKLRSNESLHKTSKKSHITNNIQACKEAKEKEKEIVYKQAIQKFECRNQKLMEENLILHDLIIKLNDDLGILVADFSSLMNRYFKTHMVTDDICISELSLDSTVKKCTKIAKEYIELLHTILDVLKDRLPNLKLNSESLQSVDL